MSICNHNWACAKCGFTGRNRNHTPICPHCRVPMQLPMRYRFPPVFKLSAGGPIAVRFHNRPKLRLVKR